ncbi:hypothetical protein SLEP1_g41259 [Rubroshorea leprosula]|uniref:Uncharacterized protein n=1 Tax=Rubroshorea leprosula TaxID=152421 RepID=A0AAV5L7A1_9ROSI|nr:hypothetical protein SLEP1_g41259 [Rubroshorea leprosula]
MIPIAEDVERHRENIIVKSWLEAVNGVLFYTEDIFLEIKKANIFGQTAEVQSSANKPWKLILSLYNKISRFMHYYREKGMVSKVKYITVTLEEILGAGKQLLKETLDERTQSGIQYISTTLGKLVLPLQILHTDVRTYLGKLRNSSNQIPTELIKLRSVLEDTMPVVEDAERYRENIMVKLWLAEMVEVLLYTADIFSEIEHANIFGQTAEVQSSANKPWKLILNLFNKISRFMHYYREKWMVFKLKYRTAEIKENLDEGKQLLKEIPDEGTQFGPQNRSTTPDRNNLERKPSANAMLDAMGNYGKARNLFKRNPAHAISTTFENGQTALHVAIAAGQLRIAKELITITSREENSHYLRIKDKSGNTALSFAAHRGMMEIAKCLIEKDKNLLTIPNGDDKLPVQLACRAGHEDMTRYLYCETPRQCLRGDNGFYLLEECINKKMFDIALNLLHRFPKFAVYRIFKKNTNPIILTLAQTLSPFVRGDQLAFWRRWIYNCTRAKVDKRGLLSDVVAIVVAQRRAKKIYDVKLMDAIAREILCFISRRLSALDGNEFEQSGAVEATFQAIKNGLPEIVIEIAKVNTNILWNRKDPEDSMNMLECAIAHRQEEVAQFLYELKARTSTNIDFTHNRDGNSLLHLAAKLDPRSKLDHISGAARLQSELRWFNVSISCF